MSAEGAGALTGLKIVDLGTVVAAPSCSQLLADHGADVIKVEPPHGDDSRRMGPSYRDGFSAHFTGMNRNKRSLALDLTKADGRAAFLRLLGDADVLMENLKPGSLAKLGLDYAEVLKPRFPKLVYCHITGFGAEGELGGLPGYDPIGQAFSGIMSWNGHAEGEPVRISANLVDMLSGAYLATAILMGLRERDRSGQGQEIEVTLLDAALNLTHPFAADWFFNGSVPARIGNRHPSAAPYNVFPTRDGHILICAVNDSQFRKLCDAIGRPDFADDPRFEGLAGRTAHQDELEQALRAAFAAENKRDLALRLLRLGVPAGPVLNLGEALSQTHVRERGAILEGEGGYRGIASPIRMSRTPATLRRLPPRFGAHNREVLREAGFDEDEIAALIEGRVLIEGAPTRR